MIIFRKYISSITKWISYYELLAEICPKSHLSARCNVNDIKIAVGVDIFPSFIYITSWSMFSLKIK